MAKLNNGLPTVPLSSSTGLPTDIDYSCLFLSLRHLGDAVIGAGMINALHRHNPKMAIDVLGRPELEQAIRTFCSIRNYINIDIPVFGHHNRSVDAMINAVRTMMKVRHQKYDCCINLIGDVRENLCGRLTGAKWNIAPMWEGGHLFRRKMTATGASRFTNRGIFVPVAYKNFYEAADYFASQLGLQSLNREQRVNSHPGLRSRIIAIHTGASHASRVWPPEKWRILISLLRLRSYKVVMLGADFERPALLRYFERDIASGDVDLVTGSVSAFASRVVESDVLIGMDSFSVHAAHSLGVPAVVLNGSADPAIFTPPGSIAVSAGDQCRYYPCYYDYPCEENDNKYICMRGIEPATVMDALDLILERGNSIRVEQARGGGR